MRPDGIVERDKQSFPEHRGGNCGVIAGECGWAMEGIAHTIGGEKTGMRFHGRFVFAGEGEAAGMEVRRDPADPGQRNLGAGEVIEGEFGASGEAGHHRRACLDREVEDRPLDGAIAVLPAEDREFQCLVHDHPRRFPVALPEGDVAANAVES